MSSCRCKGDVPRATERDRLITLRKPDTGTDKYGQPAVTYSDVAKVWASYQPVNLREYVASRQTEGQIDATFIILWRTDLRNDWVILYRGQLYDIQSAIELGRQEALRILTPRAAGLMADVKVTVTGLKELQESLRQLPGKLQEKLLVQAMSRAAKVLQDEMKARAPIRADPRPMKISKGGGQRFPGYLRKNIGRMRVEKFKGDSVSYQIGPRKGAFYGLMVELGTRHSGKRPFMRPAIDAKGKAAVDKMAETLRAGLARVVQGVKR